jgi:F-type H+-transporting ATPase subunit gamma
MASLKTLKEKITGIQKTAKVTKAMESISAIKMRKAQADAIVSRRYAYMIFSILKRVSKVSENKLNEFFKENKNHNSKTGILLVSTNKGLTGAMNVNLFKKTKQVMEENNLSKKEVVMYCIGKKAFEFAKREGFEIGKYFEDINEKTEMEALASVSEELTEIYTEKSFKKIITIYTNFINTSEQKAVSKTILPVIFEDVKFFVDDILPSKGKYADIRFENDDVESIVEDEVVYEFEPSVEKVMKDMVPYFLNIGIFYSLLETRASEYSARMMAMKNATEKSLEIADSTRKKFNKVRQAAVTQEISEIVSGMESMK